MDPVIIVSIVAVIGTIAMAIIGYVFIVPSEREHAEQQLRATQQAKADGLKVGADAVKQVVEQQTAKIDEQLAKDKKRDAVEVANELLKRKKS